MILSTKVLTEKNKWLPFQVSLSDISGVIEPDKDSDKTSIIILNGQNFTIKSAHSEVSKLFNSFKKVTA